MQTINRKNFFKTLGIMGIVSILPDKSEAKFLQPLSLFEQTLQKKRVLRVAHLTDIHVKSEKISEYGMASALETVNNLSDKPDFIINGGDSIMNAASFSKLKVKEQWQAFHRLMQNHNSLEIRHCIGNHDLYGWALPGSDCEHGKQWAMDEYNLQMPHYSFQQNGWNFIVLDSIHPRKTFPGYFGKLDEFQLQWLKQKLLEIPSEQPICIVSHIPILAICTFFDGSYVNHNHWFVPDNALHNDAIVLRDLFNTHKNVKACISGHIHLIDHVNYLGTDYYCNGAVSGAWWKGNHQQFAPSFSVMNFYSDGSSDREVHCYNWK